jgi:hypothetical protein
MRSLLFGFEVAEAIGLPRRESLRVLFRKAARTAGAAGFVFQHEMISRKANAPEILVLRLKI